MSLSSKNQVPSRESIRLGRYKHFKGGLYEVVGLARHSETLEDLVIYRALPVPQADEGRAVLWARPRAMFEGYVMHAGMRVMRFERFSPTGTAAKSSSLPSGPLFLGDQVSPRIGPEDVKERQGGKDCRSPEDVVQKREGAYENGSGAC